MDTKLCIMCKQNKKLGKFKKVLTNMSWTYSAVCLDCCGDLGKNESKYYRSTRKVLKKYEKTTN